MEPRDCSQPGASEGQVQTGFDTFVMTGDMIIKTTPKQADLSTRLKAVNKSPSLSGNAEDRARNFNGSSSEVSPLEIVGFPRFPDIPVELDIPPDDISSDDERCRFDGSVDLDVTNLPSPPAEFLGDFAVSDNGGPVMPAAGVSESWQTSLDKAILRLESSSTLSCEKQQHDPVMDGNDSSTGRANSSGTLASAAVGGVRASKSQDNWLQCGGSAVGLVNIDVDGSAVSVEALNCDLAVASSFDSLPLRDRSHEVSTSLYQSADDVRQRNAGTVAMPDVCPTFPKSCVYTESSHLPLESSDDTNGVQSHSGTASCSLDSYSAEHEHQNLDSCVEGPWYSSSQRLLGGGKGSPVRRPYPPHQNGTQPATASSHQSPTAVHSNSSDAGRPQLKDVDYPSACRLAKRLYHLDGFRKSDVAKHLSKKNEFTYLVGVEYARYFELAGSTLDAALREFLRRLVVTGETQERERILAHFSRRYLECNPRTFHSEDACHTLTCAVMLLNTDLHRQNAGKKMTLNDFIENLAELNEGENFSYEVLSGLYNAIRREPLEFELDEDDVNSTAAAAQQGQTALGSVGHNPFLDIPDPNKTTEYKKGYVMRKCCTDPDGRKTALGRRGWRMYYATLCDMVLYLHKDERSFKQSLSFGTPTNAVRIHHSLATRASDYIKKQHVFRLCTADWSQSLFQASSSDECQSWISAVNLVAASLSAPPLPGAVGSQRKFQRPLLPCSYTKLSMKEQLQQHEGYLNQIDADLAEHTRQPPERGARARIIQDYVEKENYLQFEQERFRTYCTLLHMRLCTPVSSVSDIARSASVGTADIEYQTSIDSDNRTSRSRSTSSADGKRSSSDRYSYRAAISHQQGD